MLKKILARASVAAFALFGSAVAMASTAPSATDGPFGGFSDTVVKWTEGPLGVGLSVTMMLVGAGMGIARNSPMPALSGVAGAAFLNWGPDIIVNLITGGALI